MVIARDDAGARIALVVGTRPEAIKLAPVYHELERAGAEPVIILTGQHDELLDPHIRHFGFERRRLLDMRREGDNLAGFTGRCVEKLASELAGGGFDACLVQGDTCSALAGALASALMQVPLGHVEAGLRTCDIDNPFPEELNRQLIARASTWHFAPTIGAESHLLAERVGGDIHVVGNTVIDAARWTARHGVERTALEAIHPELGSRPHVLVTAHRRESFGAPMGRIAEAIARLAGLFRGIDFIVPLHPNPAAHVPMQGRLDQIDNVRMTGPLPYPVTIGLIASSLAVLTDSGGLQEEAPTFGVPVLVMRETTERPEGVDAGCCKLVGTDIDGIVTAFANLIATPRTRVPANPYGDGHAAERISGVLIEALEARALAC